MASLDKITLQAPSMCDWDIIVAFDIGTSYSGYAYSDRKQFKDGRINLNEWTGNFNYDKTAKAPSIVLLNEDRAFDSFGYEAEAKYAKKVKDKTHLKYYRFRNFKMRLYYEKVIFPNIIVCQHLIKASTFIVHLLFLLLFCNRTLKKHLRFKTTEGVCLFQLLTYLKT